jgi:hypothetical protein
VQRLSGVLDAGMVLGAEPFEDGTTGEGRGTDRQRQAAGHQRGRRQPTVVG